MIFEKKGRIYSPNNFAPWAVSHAMLPTPYLRKDGVLRIFVAFCDKNTVGRIGYVDCDPNKPSKILNVSKKPVLDIGQPGSFDENGVNPISLVKYHDQLYLYYFGYQKGINRPYFLFSGLAISHDDGETFTRYQNTPILDRTSQDFYLRSAPHVLKNNDGWHLWYVGGNRWTKIRGKELPIYSIKYSRSMDGKKWGQEGQLCLDPDEREHGFGRPFVMKKKGGYEMLYSRRFKDIGYRLGYAISANGIDWVRKDNEISLNPSKDGWDSEMICYGSVFRTSSNKYLFYNGNGYGRSGFGYATIS